MNEVKEQKTEKQVGEKTISKKEIYQPLMMKVVDVKVEKGYATSAAPTSAPQWDNGSW